MDILKRWKDTKKSTNGPQTRKVNINPNQIQFTILNHHSSRNRPIILKDCRSSSGVSSGLDTVGPLNSNKHLNSSKKSRLHKQCFVRIQNATEPSAKGKPSMSAWQTQRAPRGLGKRSASNAQELNINLLNNVRIHTHTKCRKDQRGPFSKGGLMVNYLWRWYGRKMGFSTLKPIYSL